MERMTWEAKPGRRQDFIAWCKKLADREENRGLAMRIYATEFGVWNKVTIEVDFETLEDWQKYWADLEWTDELKAFLASNADMLLRGETRELFTLQ